ncbi:MAG: UvrD-helicase domain-containing protein, partial [Planctomycetota bacterium]
MSESYQYAPKPEQPEQIDPFALASDQYAALDLTTNRVISASAGTGKTHTLRALYVGLLAGRVAPGGSWLSEDAWLKFDRKPDFKPRAIVAVTFTRKAAAELLERAQQALELLLRRDDLPPVLKEHLRQCREEISSAPVCTIDAFCSRLLREAGMSGPAPIAFTTLEKNEADELLEEALSDAATQLLEAGGDEQLKLLAHEWGVFGGTGLIGVGMTLLARLRVRGLPPAALIKENKLLSLAEIRERLQDTLTAIRNVPDKGKSKPGAKAREFCEQPPPFTDEQNLRRAVLQLSSLLRGSDGNLYKWAECAGIKDTAPDILATLHIATAKALIGYLERGLELYAAIKRRSGVVDFNDLLLFTRQLLKENPQAADGYSFVLIDEFQDTNPLQCEILRRVAFGGSGAPQSGAVRLAVVGDRKQSIYRFRGADVQLMTQAEKEFTPAPLQGSFRSRKPLLDFVNDLFSTVGDLCYDETDHLKEQAPPERHAWQGPPAELLTYTDKGKADPHRWQQACAIAKRIRCLVSVATGPQLTRPQIWDKRERRLRQNTRYSDIAILSRSVKHIRIPLQLALAQMGIPFRMMGGLSFYTRSEVLDVVNLLACVVNPDDNLSVVGFLRSPFVGLSDGALWRLVFGEQDRAAKNLYSRLQEAAVGPATKFAAADHAAIRQATRLLTELHAGLGRCTAAELIDRACVETGFLSVLAMLPQGEVAVAAVRRVIELSRDFEARRARHLSDFVEWLKGKADAEWDDPGRDDNPDLTANLPEVEDAVQIGTIHSAKGLEFPIVILVDIGAKKLEQFPSALYTPETGLGLRLGLKLEGLASVADRIHQAAVEFEKQANNAELARLLYVAVTRTRDYVIFSGETDSKDTDNWRNLIGTHQQKSPQQIVAVPHDHPELLAAQAAAQTSAVLLDSGTPILRESIAAQLAQVPDAPIIAVGRGLLARRDLRVNVTWLTQWLSCPRRAALTLVTPHPTPPAPRPPPPTPPPPTPTPPKARAQ